MRKIYLILIGLALILAFTVIAGPINTVVLGLIIGTALLVYAAIYMLWGIVDYFEKTPSSIRFAWSPKRFVFNKKDLIKAVIGFLLSVAGLVVLWTVIARHPLIYSHLKEMGII